MSDVNKTIELYEKSKAYDELKPEFNHMVKEMEQLKKDLHESQVNNIIHGKEGYIHLLKKYDVIDKQFTITSIKDLAKNLNDIIISKCKGYIEKDKYSNINFIETQFLKTILEVALDNVDLFSFINLNFNVLDQHWKHEFINMNEAKDLIKKEYLKSISAEDSLKINDYPNLLNHIKELENTLVLNKSELTLCNLNLKKANEKYDLEIENLKKNHFIEMTDFKSKVEKEAFNKALAESKIYIANLEITTTNAEVRENELSIKLNELRDKIKFYIDKNLKIKEKLNSLELDLNKYYRFRLFPSKLLKTILSKIRELNFDLYE